jgi:hypothetical protein
LRTSFLELSVSALDPEVVPRMLRGELLGAIVRGAFGVEAMAALQIELEAGTLGVVGGPMTAYRGEQYGRNLVVTDDPDEYFDEAARLSAGLASHRSAYEERVRTLITDLSGLEVSVPVAPDGRRYAPCTARRLVPGGTIDLHCELETRRFGTMSALSSLADLSAQLSFYAPMVLPDGGGELHVYPLRFEDGEGAALGRMSRSAPATITWAEGHGVSIPRPRVGDLLVFDAGRHFHRVSRVEGDRARWTIGGFLARSRDGTQLLQWS